MSSLVSAIALILPKMCPDWTVTTSDGLERDLVDGKRDVAGSRTPFGHCDTSPYRNTVGWFADAADIGRTGMAMDLWRRSTAVLATSPKKPNERHASARSLDAGIHEQG
jgi:hypothetical protein